MKFIGLILFFIGIGLIAWMLFMGNINLSSDIIYNRSTLKTELFFGLNKQLFALLGSTLAICGTLMSIFCNGFSDETKRCASCNEVINNKAKKCKHCHEWTGGEE